MGSLQLNTKHVKQSVELVSKLKPVHFNDLMAFFYWHSYNKHNTINPTYGLSESHSGSIWRIKTAASIVFYKKPTHEWHLDVYHRWLMRLFSREMFSCRNILCIRTWLWGLSFVQGSECIYDASAEPCVTVELWLVSRFMLPLSLQLQINMHYPTVDDHTIKC